MDEITLTLTPTELDFILKVLGNLPTYQTVQAGQLGLIPKMLKQANAPATQPVDPSP